MKQHNTKTQHNATQHNTSTLMCCEFLCCLDVLCCVATFLNILGFTIDSLSSRLRPDRANSRICLKAWILGEQVDAEVLAPKASPTETVTVNI